MSRSSELLKAAAAALEDGRNPLDGSWFTEHDVTFLECYDLADSLALGALLVAWAMDNPRKAVIAAQGAGDSLKMDAITRLLAKLNAKGA